MGWRWVLSNRCPFHRCHDDPRPTTEVDIVPFSLAIGCPKCWQGLVVQPPNQPYKADVVLKRCADGQLLFMDVYGTLWLFNIAMGNGPFIVDLPIKKMVIFHGYVK